MNLKKAKPLYPSSTIVLVYRYVLRFLSTEIDLIHSHKLIGSKPKMQRITWILTFVETHSELLRDSIDVAQAHFKMDARETSGTQKLFIIQRKCLLWVLVNGFSSFTEKKEIIQTPSGFDKENKLCFLRN